MKKREKIHHHRKHSHLDSRSVLFKGKGKAKKNVKLLKYFLSVKEIELLQRANINSKTIVGFRSALELHEKTGIGLENCKRLFSTFNFQHLGSVGPKLADKIYEIGFRSIEDLASADPTEMYERMCRHEKMRVDPCVEDVFRCAVAQAKFPDMIKEEARQWHRWGALRGQHTVTSPDPSCDSADDKKLKR